MSDLAFISNKSERRKVSAYVKSFYPNGFTPKQVVDLARPNNSPIHKYFEWDDSIAAEQHRLHQARNLIACLVVEIEDREVKEFHSVVVDDCRKYVSVKKVLSSKSLYGSVVYEALQRFIHLREAYKNLKELGPIVDSINQVERKLNNEKVKNRKGATNKNTSGRNTRSKDNSHRSISANG